MVLTRSARRTPTSGSSESERKLKIPKNEVEHDHHAPKPSKLAKEDSYEAIRGLANAEADDNAHATLGKGDTSNLRQGKTQSAPLVGSISRKPLEAAIAVPYLKEDLYEVECSVPNAAADIRIHSTLAAEETYIPDQGVSNLYTAPLMSSLWNVATSINEYASQREESMVLGNINNSVEERVRNLFQRDDHHDASQTVEMMPLHAAGMHENLSTVTGDMNSSQKRNNVASTDISNVLEDLSKNSQHQQCTSYNLTAIAEQLYNDDDDDEVDSVLGDRSLVSVEGYKVKHQLEDLLRSILSKQGDIAANCSHKSENIRSYFMQSICDVIHKLNNTSMTDISESEVEQILSFLDDIEGAVVEIAWLKKRLHEIREAKQAIPMLRSSSELKRGLAERKSKIQRTRKELAFLENKIRNLRIELSADEEEVKKTEMVIAEHKRKLKLIFELESLGDGLL